MSSRRKSTTPCMLPPQGALDSDQEMDSEGSAPHDANDVASAKAGGYECKYCSFRTRELNLFTVHVDSEHPDVVLNASYVCVECDFHTKSYDTLLTHNARLHPGEDSFTRTMVKKNKETVFQQTVNDLTFDGNFVKMEEDEETSRGAIALSKTPIMRSKARPENRKLLPPTLEEEEVIKVESDEDEENKEPPTLTPPPPTAPPRLLPVSALQGVVVNSLMQVKGGVATAGGVPAALPGGVGGVLPPGTLAQVLSALQNQQSGGGGGAQLLIPISSIPTYNTAMDNNLLLLNAYSRFPYPSLTEILGLSSQTKFSEEQIKVWFSAQRLKHGVSWTPEEVEEARRKKFNGTVQSVPPTITVIPANMAAGGGGLQSIFQTCQIVGQPSLVLTQVSANGGSVPVASPITLTVAGVHNNQPKVAEPSSSDSKSDIPPASAAAALGLISTASKPKKSKEQLAELKASYGRRAFASEAEISRLMTVTKLSKRAIKKWFSDTRYNQRNAKDTHGLPLSEGASGAGPTAAGWSMGGTSCPQIESNAATIVIDSSDDAGDSSPSACVPVSSRAKFRHVFPDFPPQKFKEKTTEQLSALDASFAKSSTPSDEELSRLRVETKLTRREVDAWFTERRKTISTANDDGEDDNNATLPSPSTLPGGLRTTKRTPEQLTILKKTFIRTQWPTAEEYDQMAAQSGLKRTYIVNWFGDTRYAWKNNTLKWYYLYQTGKVDEALNGGGKLKKPRRRFRGWLGRARRPYPYKHSPQGGAAPIKVKAGVAFLREYYVKHGALSEKDLDELVSKSSMSYQQVRDWFTEQEQDKEQDKEDQDGETSERQT
ncbi:zinc fingers and homeoboxes protein 1-like isoform X2 [Gouania willdenowi]|uniref:zinc fingers and homeoboxes protein 1-like isoform X2 n=1 Tax=Gouania willdenowi TaxID=441366 RepID=UPI001056D8C2|nr:zinc fingers and homeoboxes protein 1-like isoform X2 [Gouania willdenowi]